MPPPNALPDAEKLVVKYIGTDLRELYHYTLTKAKGDNLADTSAVTGGK